MRLTPSKQLIYLLRLELGRSEKCISPVATSENMYDESVSDYDLQNHSFEIK